MGSTYQQIEQAYRNFSQQVLDSNILDRKSKVLANLTAAIAIGDRDFIDKNLLVAKQSGFSNEEIANVYAIVGFAKTESVFGKNNISCCNSKSAKGCCS